MSNGIKRIFLTPLDDVSTTDKEGVGVLRFEGNKIYKYVKFLNSTATVAGADGDVVAYAAATGHSTNTVVNDRDDADASPVAAGVLQAAVTGTAGTAYYCWIQIKGPETLSTAIGGSAGDGDMLMAGTTDKAVEKLVFTEGAPNVIQGALVGVATDASAKLVALDCPF